MDTKRAIIKQLTISVIMKYQFNLLRVVPAMVLLVLISSCNTKKSMVASEHFGEKDGKEISLFTLVNKAGNTVKLTNWGATIVSIEVPDREGNRENITFGYDTFDEYINGDPYFGSMVGRYANRIANGKFTIDGVEYQLTLNNGPNTLHGGPGGWHSVAWETTVLEGTDFPAVRFNYTSPDMEEGYPGTMEVEVTYTWTDDNELVMDYKCTTDKPTVLNITNHAYFNLKGAGIGEILDHEVTINASRFVPVDENLIPTGELRDVKGTPFDFLQPHKVGERINDNDQQMILGRGYDHTFVLDKKGDVDAVVYEPVSGRVLEVTTDQPGVQFYTGNFLDGTQLNDDGLPFQYRGGLCLETQHFPDSPNQADFPTTRLDPGEAFLSSTTYKFSVRK